MSFPSSLAIPPTADAGGDSRAGSIPFASPRVHFAALLATAALLLWGFDDGVIDLALAGAYFDPVSKGFPWHHHWLFEAVLHRGLKSLLVALSLAAIAWCIWAARRPGSWLPRRRALGLALGLLLIPLATTVLKLLTNRHCPWSLEAFGGFAPYVGLLEQAPADLVAGQCFPAGHASAGLAWLIWGFMLWDIAPRRARWGLFGGLALGLLMGWARMMQGAHFLSHVLWSVWVAWAVSVALATWLVAPGRAPVRGTP